jgi:hypothetical protein
MAKTTVSIEIEYDGDQYTEEEIESRVFNAIRNAKLIQPQPKRVIKITYHPILTDDGHNNHTR